MGESTERHLKTIPLLCSTTVTGLLPFSPPVMRDLTCIPWAEKEQVAHISRGSTLSPASANAFCISTSHEEILNPSATGARGVWKTSRIRFLTVWQIICHETQRLSCHPGYNIPYSKEWVAAHRLHRQSLKLLCFLGTHLCSSHSLFPKST